MTKKQLIERVQDVYDEVRPEITRVNETAGETIFNPCATGMVDDIENIIFELENK